MGLETEAYIFPYPVGYFRQMARFIICPVVRGGGSDDQLDSYISLCKPQPSPLEPNGNISILIIKKWKYLAVFLFSGVQ